jgi:arylsulfatase A-like enzyme
VERPADQRTITRRYTEEAVRFIGHHKDGPFFLYLAHTMPHVPLFASDEFLGKSRRGLYGDVIEEIDWSVGQVLDTLRDQGLAENTLVFFTSDNGPWLVFGDHGGSAGLLRGGKGSTWEGGMREPTIAWWPGQIAPGTTSAQLASTMDIFATACSLAGTPLPDDREMDCYDLTPTLLGKGESERELFFYYRAYQLMAVRKGPWKMHLSTQNGYGQPEPEQHDPPMLFNIEHDPGEERNVAADHPDVIAEMMRDIEAHQAKLKPAPSQLEL